MLHLFGFGLVFKNKLMGPSLTLEQKGQLFKGLIMVTTGYIAIQWINAEKRKYASIEWRFTRRII